MIVVFYLGFSLVLGLIAWYSWVYGITPTPTSTKVKKQILHLLPKNIRGEIVELGSGWGTLAFALARQFPCNAVRGYEISLIPYLLSLGVAHWFSYPNLRLIREDFFNVSLTQASLVVCYLYPEAMMRLKVKFERELAPETYILSHTFAIPGWIPVAFARAPDLYQTPIYLYQMRHLI